ncbi:MAG: hypothetical protein L0Y66_01530 [Myxococcaceae bacterium]|nr:hypothetical protein [Myxococcaceae bacterium]MCI0672564.1 hypothetical protein [Myxococcaceae bacterium]
MRHRGARLDSPLTPSLSPGARGLCRRAVGALALLLASLLAACTCNPEDAARSFAGSSARDCGSKTAEARAGCALAAQDAGVPFYLVEERLSRNGVLPFGFARNATGESAAFTYDVLGTPIGANSTARVAMRSCERIGTNAEGVLTCESPGRTVAVCR